jgi:glutamate racemase
VPAIEAGDMPSALLALKEYLAHFQNSAGWKIDALLLGCTHYAIIRDEIRKLVPLNIAIVSQDTVVPGKTREYLARHSEIECQLSQGRTREFYATSISEELKKSAAKWFGEDISIKIAVIEPIA